MRGSCWSRRRPGITLAPEGGQHQSINTPLIGMAADRLASFEPAHVDELAILLRHAFVHMQAADGSAVWLRLSTRQLAQPDRALDPAAVIAGGALGRAAGDRVRGSRSPTRGRWRRRPKPRSPNSRRRSPAPGCWRSPAPTGCTPAGWRRQQARRHGERGRAVAYRGACWRRWRPGAGAGDGAGRASGQRMPGWARCAASASCRWVRTISARAAIFRICTASTASTPTRSWTPAPRRCWARRAEGARPSWRQRTQAAGLAGEVGSE